MSAAEDTAARVRMRKAHAAFKAIGELVRRYYGGRLQHLGGRRYLADEALAHAKLRVPSRSPCYIALNDWSVRLFVEALETDDAIKALGKRGARLLPRHVRRAIARAERQPWPSGGGAPTSIFSAVTFRRK
jgi:hypothetical protein